MPLLNGWVWGVRHQRLTQALLPLPCVRRHRRGKWRSPDPVSGSKPLLQKPIFWGSAAAVIVIVIAIVAAVAASGNHAGNAGLATTTTVSLGTASSARRQRLGSRSGGEQWPTQGGGLTQDSGSASTTRNTTATKPSQLPIGGTASFSNGGAPEYDLTVTQFVDPAQPAKPGVTPKNAGDIFVAVALSFKNTGTADVSQDIYNDTTLYNSTGQGYDGNFESTASGPDFPVGVVSNAGVEPQAGGSCSKYQQHQRGSRPPLRLQKVWPTRRQRHGS